MAGQHEFPKYTYTKRYDSSSIHGIEAQRPWDLTEEIISRISRSGTLVDIGCGPIRKIIPIARSVDHVIGVDHNPEVLEKAAENIREANVENISLLLSDGNNLSLGDSTADMVTYMLAPHNAKEAYRILKPGGIVIVERTGELDKRNIKELFGKDATGKVRGHNAELEVNSVATSHEKDFQNAGFRNIEWYNGFWNTWYSIEGLKVLLRETPTIREYDETSDQEIVKRVETELMTDNGILTQQHRVLVIAKK